MRNKFIILILFVLIFVGCSNKSELDKILESNNYIIVDVRTNEEYLEGHIVNSINIPYDEIDPYITLDINKTILVYCKSGVRADIAKSTLEGLGFSVYNLGGFDSINMDKE